jgi:hypothetical protein
MIDLFWMIVTPPVRAWLILILVTLYVWPRAGKPEISALIAVYVWAFASVVFWSGTGASFQGVEAGLMAVDLIFLLFLIHLSLTSDRFWPLWMTGFHLTSILVHMAMVIAPDIMPWAYATAQGFWSYPMLLSLLLGCRESTARKFSAPSG